MYVKGSSEWFKPRRESVRRRMQKSRLAVVSLGPGLAHPQSKNDAWVAEPRELDWLGARGAGAGVGTIISVPPCGSTKQGSFSGGTRDLDHLAAALHGIPVRSLASLPLAVQSSRACICRLVVAARPEERTTPQSEVGD